MRAGMRGPLAPGAPPVAQGLLAPGPAQVGAKSKAGLAAGPRAYGGLLSSKARTGVPCTQGPKSGGRMGARGLQPGPSPTRALSSGRREAGRPPGSRGRSWGRPSGARGLRSPGACRLGPSIVQVWPKSGGQMGARGLLAARRGRWAALGPYRRGPARPPSLGHRPPGRGREGRRALCRARRRGRSVPGPLPLAMKKS